VTKLYIFPNKLKNTDKSVGGEIALGAVKGARHDKNLRTIGINCSHFFRQNYSYQKSLSAKDFRWICYQNWLCPWSLKKILLSLSIFRRPWKFLNSC